MDRTGLLKVNMMKILIHMHIHLIVSCMDTQEKIVVDFINIEYISVLYISVLYINKSVFRRR